MIMNKRFQLICGISSFMILLISCNKDMEFYTLEIPQDVMHLVHVPENDIILDVNKEKDIAVTFNWNAADNMGTEQNLTYYFKMGLADKMDKSMVKIQLDEGVRTYSLTHQILNNYLKKWGISSGQLVEVQVEVIALKKNMLHYERPEVSYSTFAVTTY